MSWTYQCEPQDSHLAFKSCSAIEELNQEDWNAAVKDAGIFLQLNYLNTLESSLKKEMRFKYIVFYNDDNQPIGVCYMQIIDFMNVNPKHDDVLSKIGAQIKSKLLGALGIRIMICGNIFASGENGFYFHPDFDRNAMFDNISHALFQMRILEKGEKQPSAVLIKEFWPGHFEESDRLLKYDFKDFMVDVNMVLDIHEEWKTMDDYLASMVTKFRTKAKGAFKKSKDLEVRDLSLEEIIANEDEIAHLYENVVEHADFQVSKMNGKTFEEYKRQLGDLFVLQGYFLENQLVGFLTAFQDGDIFEAGYVGLDYEHNYKYAVYQRILYDYVELAMNRGCKQLRLGRTAEEIKSCLGAEPVNMKLYVRHRNTLSNKLIKPIVGAISPSEFEIRKPFKKSVS